MGASLEDWLALLERRHPRAIDLGLQRCGRVYQKLGSPRPARQVISVAGTNGKGSAVAYLSSLLDAQGFKRGSYSSPHLLKFNERLNINAQPVADADLVAAFEAVESARDGESLTYFEFTTLACVYILARSGLDFAILEVGLGGRLDTVNIIDADCAVIMPVGLDHQDFLGKDRESIGHEKAGIMRAGKPAVCAEAVPPLTVTEHARELGAELVLCGRDFDFEEKHGNLLFAMGGHHLELPAPPLVGDHQLANLATALAALGALSTDLLKHQRQLAEGVAATQLPGRMQRHPGDSRLLMDVGHNPMAARVVKEWLDKNIGCACCCVLAMYANKDAEAVVKTLGNSVSHWYCAGLPGPRGQSGAALANRVRSVIAGAGVCTFESVPPALEKALEGCGEGGLVLVFGSFETVAQAMKYAS